MLKRAYAGLPALLLLATLTACGSDDADESGDTDSNEPGTAASGACEYVADGSSTDVELPPAEPTVEETAEASVTTSVGAFTMTLDGANAPCTVNSFVSLVEQGFYDKTPCHRLTISDVFKVVQCGDPTGTGRGGPGYTIPAEFDGTETYPAGTLAMARGPEPDSGGSQFFVTYGNTQLDPAYTVFGTVDQAGIDAIASAAAAGVEPEGAMDGAPVTPISITGITMQ